MTPDEPVPPITETKPIPKPRRRRWSISLRGLMLLVLIVGGLIGWEVNRVARIRKAVAVLERVPKAPPADPDPNDLPRPLPPMGFDSPSAVQVIFGDESANGNWLGVPRSAWLPDWLQWAVGEDHFRHVTALMFSRRPTPEDWDAIETLGTVQGLDFSEVDLADDDLSRLPICWDLRGLSLFDTKITDKALAGVAGLRNLRSLDLRLTKVSDAGLAPLANLTQLMELQLSFGAGTDSGLFHLQGLKNLRKLDVDGSNNEVSDLGLSYLRGMTQLEELSFNARHVTDKGIAVLVELPRLESLEIDPAFPKVAEAISLSRAGVELLGRFGHLETLHLTALMAVDDTWLESIGRLTRLRHLVIGGDKITDAGLTHLSALTNLEELRISSPKVTDAGLKHLHPLTRLMNLSFYARIGDDGIASIRTALPALKRVNNARWPNDGDPMVLAPMPMPPTPVRVLRAPGRVAPAP